MLMDRLLERLESQAGHRVALETLQALLIELEPALKTSPEKRSRLHDALEEGEEAGRLKLPASPRLYTGQPPLPRWVAVLGRAAREPATVPGRGYFWRPELAWASELRFTRDEIEFLKRVNGWMRDLRPEEPTIPMRERSLEITGDEKVIQRLLGKRIFREDRLSLSRLRCSPTTPPFGYAVVGPAPVLLAVENQDTYWSIRRLLRPEHGIGLVAYGVGNVFASSVAYALELERPVERILYFGDVDARGLEIPLLATATASRVGLPEVLPCVHLYRLLFGLAHSVASDSKPLSPGSARHRAAWLPAEVRTEAVRLLQAAHRLAQEAVGYKALAEVLVEPVDLTVHD
jgi:hypothetical protein